MTTEGTERLYTRVFFQAFAASGLFMTGVSLQYHFGEYLAHLGLDVHAIGRVMSAGVLGTLLIRLHIGGWIDRLGPRRTWWMGTLVVAAAVAAMQFTSRLGLIILLRMISQVAVAAVLTSVAVFAAHLAPPPRRAESIGTLGLAGFTGSIVGPTLGDWIFAGGPPTAASFHLFFTAAASCSLLAGLVMMRINLPDPAGELASAHASRPPLRRLLREHWPGPILLVGLVFSMVSCLPSVYLERLAEAAGFHDIKVFFLVYGPTAITLRIVFRRLPERIGRPRTLCLGMTLMAFGLLAMCGAQRQAQLVLPALLMGAGHSYIYPSMIDLAADRLPPRFRGTGTAAVLAAGDLGMLLGYTVLGELIGRAGFDAALGFLAIAVLVALAVFVLRNRVSR